MVYTKPEMAFKAIEPHPETSVALFNDGYTMVSAMYDGRESVTVWAENDVDMVAEMNCYADPSDVALTVESVYAKCGVDNPSTHEIVHFPSAYVSAYEDEDEEDQVSIVAESEAMFDELFDTLIADIVEPAEVIDITEDQVETVKNAVLGILGFKFGFGIRRPSFIEKDGEVIFTEFPYQELDGKQEETQSTK